MTVIFSLPGIPHTCHAQGGLLLKHFLVTILILLTAMPAFGAGFAKVGTFGYTYDGMFTGGRNTALGQADMAGAFGSEATQINTAPLPLDDGAEVSYNRNPFLSKIDQEVWGGAVDFRGLRLGFSQFIFSMDPQLVRTAYNPEGTGETFDAGDKITVVCPATFRSPQPVASSGDVTSSHQGMSTPINRASSWHSPSRQA